MGDPALQAIGAGARRPTAFGRYQLLERIAHGGMAELFAARMSGAGGFEKLVALKRILPELAQDQQFIAMFLDEARIAATLSHPNVCQVYDIDQADGQYFISMEYLKGRDLGAIRNELRRRGRPLPSSLALRIICDVASGLHHAHEQRDMHGQPLGIIHRDVSPRNVFVTCDGVVKLVDFGIAKARDRLAVTSTGIVKGKFPYMAPEQIVDEPLDRRADVFSLGVLLWELTCGRRLFAGGTDYEVLKRILHRPVPRPSEVVPDYPAELEAVVMRALAKDRDERHASAAELQAELEAVAHTLGLEASSAQLADLMDDLFPREPTGPGLVPTTPAPRKPQALVVDDPADQLGDGNEDDGEAEIVIVMDEPAAPAARRAAPRRCTWAVSAVLATLLGLALACAQLVRPPATQASPHASGDAAGTLR